MKVGDLVADYFYGDVGIVVSGPRVSEEYEHVRFGTMEGDEYEVVDVLLLSGSVKLIEAEELRVISESW